MILAGQARELALKCESPGNEAVKSYTGTLVWIAKDLETGHYASAADSLISLEKASAGTLQFPPNFTDGIYELAAVHVLEEVSAAICSGRGGTVQDGHWDIIRARRYMSRMSAPPEYISEDYENLCMGIYGEKLTGKEERIIADIDFLLSVRKLGDAVELAESAGIDKDFMLIERAYELNITKLALMNGDIKPREAFAEFLDEEFMPLNPKPIKKSDPKALEALEKKLGLAKKEGWNPDGIYEDIDDASRPEKGK